MATDAPAATPAPAITQVISITGSRFRKEFNTSFVYGWKRGEEFLYIGQTRNGFRRLIFHNIIGVMDVLQDDDEIIIWYTPIELLSVVESYMILQYKPKLNNYRKPKVRPRKGSKPCLVCNKSFRTKDPIRRFCSIKCKREYYKKKESGIPTPSTPISPTPIPEEFNARMQKILGQYKEVTFK
jgi:hypothetical protein